MRKVLEHLCRLQELDREILAVLKSVVTDPAVEHKHLEILHVQIQEQAKCRGAIYFRTVAG
ncbi:hypothetical protein WDW86_11370 [Bdellovibrionota bacterium FG-2]